MYAILALVLAASFALHVRVGAERSVGVPAERVRGAGAPGADTDVTGKWTFNVQTDAGSGTPTVTLKQDAEKLTGHYSSQNFGEQELTGSIKGSDFTFSFTADVQGNSLHVTYTGKVESKDALKGTVDLGGVGQGTFTAKRQ
jgi:hypothetical protein